MLIFWYVNSVFLLVASVGGQLLQPEPYDYCAPELKLCETPTEHTMCKYPGPGVSDRCVAAVREPLSASDKKRMLFLHNKFRSNIASGSDRSRNRKLPTASDMRQIYWDEELETIATRWAEQCEPASDTDKCRNIKRFRVSQNVGTRRVNGSTDDKQITQMIISWLKEGKDFEPGWVDSFAQADDQPQISQFVNVIWAETYAMGCARIVFQEENPVRSTAVERLVCNYGPGGSEPEKRVYKRGASCQNCPEGTQCSVAYPGLCALLNVDKPQKSPDVTTEATTEETDSSWQDSGTLSTTSAVDDSEGFFLEEEESCSGEGCPSEKATQPPLDQNRFNIIIKPPKPAGGKYLVKHGVYLDGKCHCSDTYRSKARESEKKYPGRGNEDKSRGGKVVRDVAGRTSAQKVENGDRCQCYELVVGSDSGASRSHFHLFCALLYLANAF